MRPRAATGCKEKWIVRSEIYDIGKWYIYKKFRQAEGEKDKRPRGEG